MDNNFYTNWYILYIFVLKIINQEMGKAEKTREFLIESTAILFNKKGYGATTLSDMTEITKLTKGSIYGNFKNKEELSLRAFQYNAQRLNLNLISAMATKESATEKLKAFTEFYLNAWKILSQSGGCPLLNAAVESDDQLPYLRKEVQESFKKWKKLIISVLDLGIKNKEFKLGISSSEYGTTFMMLIEGGILLSKIEHQAGPLKLAIQRVEEIIRSEILL